MQKKGGVVRYTFKIFENDNDNVNLSSVRNIIVYQW